MEYFLKRGCERCGGRVAIIVFKDTDFFEREITLVSHGVCEDCCLVVILPTQKIEDFMKGEK